MLDPSIVSVSFIIKEYIFKGLLELDRSTVGFCHRLLSTVSEPITHQSPLMKGDSKGVVGV